MSIPCQFCGSPSAIHLTDIVQKQKNEMHLCEACAIAHKVIPAAHAEINVTAILELVLGKSSAPVKSVPGDMICPVCGIHYAHFRSQGRLGCPHDYDTFRELLTPLMEQVQNDSSRHAGKIPERHRRKLLAVRKAGLEAELRVAVRTEQYEAAAKLRDEIRAMEANHES